MILNNRSAEKVLGLSPLPPAKNNNNELNKYIYFTLNDHYIYGLPLYTHTLARSTRIFLAETGANATKQNACHLRMLKTKTDILFMIPTYV